jgi:hypothetical protein
MKPPALLLVCAALSVAGSSRNLLEPDDFLACWQRRRLRNYLRILHFRHKLAAMTIAAAMIAAPMIKAWLVVICDPA